MAGCLGSNVIVFNGNYMTTVSFCFKNKNISVNSVAFTIEAMSADHILTLLD